MSACFHCVTMMGSRDCRRAHARLSRLRRAGAWFPSAAPEAPARNHTNVRVAGRDRAEVRSASGAYQRAAPRRVRGTVDMAPRRADRRVAGHIARRTGNRAGDLDAGDDRAESAADLRASAHRGLWPCHCGLGLREPAVRRKRALSGDVGA